MPVCTFYTEHCKNLPVILGLKKEQRIKCGVFQWPPLTTQLKRNLHLNFKSANKRILENLKLNFKFSGSGSTRDTTLALSIESLPGPGEEGGRRERMTSQCVVRPRSSLNISDGPGLTYHSKTQMKIFHFRIWCQIPTFSALAAKCRIPSNVGKWGAPATLPHNSS